MQKILILLKPNLSLFSFFHGLCFFGAVPRNALLDPRSQGLCPMFSSPSYMVLTLTFKSLTYFELLFVYLVRSGFKFSFGQVVIQLSWPHLLKKTTLFLLNCIGFYVEDQLP